MLSPGSPPRNSVSPPGSVSHLTVFASSSSATTGSRPRSAVDPRNSPASGGAITQCYERRRVLSRTSAAVARVGSRKRDIVCVCWRRAAPVRKWVEAVVERRCPRRFTRCARDSASRADGSELSVERSRGAVDASVWQPLIFDPSTSRGADNLRELESSNCVWAVDDTLHLQLQDLVRARNPGEPLSDVELGTRIDAIVGTARAETYGRWIYYPWSGRLVRVLPEPEFRELRLDRNRNKITVAEQQR